MQKVTINTVKRIEAFFDMAYRDYIASRVLINNDYVLQGATLASSAIEKYFKALLIAINGENKKVPKVHLDRLDNLKKQFENTEYYKLFEKFDDKFLNELSVVYQFRYYDNFSEPTSVGFLVNQFLGELDYMAFVFNNILKTFDNAGMERPQGYWINVKEYNKDLFNNNFILNKVLKEEFMNRESSGFGFYINPNTLMPIILTTQGKVRPGTDTTFTLKDGAKKMPIPKYSGEIFLLELRGKNDTN